MDSDVHRYILFCNEPYGRAFEEAFRRWCARHCIEDFLVVHSVRSAYSHHFLKAAVQKVLRRLNTSRNNRRGLRDGTRTIDVEDVNAPRFIESYLRSGGHLHGIVSGFNQIFKHATIEQFDKLLNFHPSLLPSYRGPDPSYWCIKNCEQSTGITLHQITADIDKGPILWQQQLTIETSDPKELSRSLSELGAGILPLVLDSFLTDSPLPSNRVDIDKVYKHRIDYRSFPTSNQQGTRAGMVKMSIEK